MSPDHLNELFRHNSFHYDSLDQVDFPELTARVDQYSFVRVSGLFGKKEIMEARSRVAADWSADRDIPALGQDVSTVKTNWQKMVIGGLNTSGVYRPRAVRTIFNPMVAEDIYGLHHLFRRLAVIRNRLQGAADDYAVDNIQNSLWTASRIHQYPPGAGFMGSHIDMVVDKVSKSAGRSRFHQVVLLMSQKGEDFQEGGGFIHAAGQQLVFEDYCQIGDVIVYDGLIEHGVADIDPFSKPDLRNFSGRLAGFVTLYKDHS